MTPYVIVYVIGIVITLMLLSEFRSPTPFIIIKTNWAIGAAILWPLFWAWLIVLALWTFVGGLVQYFKAEK